MRNINIVIPFLLSFVFCGPPALEGQKALGIEFQAYPTGLIPGIRWQNQLGEKDSYHVRLGYQWIRHRDLGKHDDERGSGFGFSLGYTRQLSGRWSIGLRNDLWWNMIDWRDGEEGPDAVSGKTDILVVQPTIILEYRLHECDHWIIAPSIAFGVEWNARTEGDPTGEGPILLLGLNVLKKL